MAKSASISIKMDPDLMEEAEMILNALGISRSIAITMFYKQIVIHNGLPFDLKLEKNPLDVDYMTKE